MNGNILNKVLNLGAKHALYRDDGHWYHRLKSFPGVLFDSNGYVIFETQSAYLEHPNLQHGQGLHVVPGISSMEEYILFTDEQKEKIIFEIKEVDEESIRRLRQVNIVVRNTDLVRKVKVKYQNTCQLCTTRLSVGKERFYSEVHHIKPLGTPHNGPDKMLNMLCVCPNCHIQLDLGAIPLRAKSFKALLHSVSEEYIQYHNNCIFYKNR